MADCASSSSSAASTTGSSSYDVFLSFSGEDNPNNFTAFLNLALKNRGINVLIDDEKLRTGEAIGPSFFRSIESSKISIPILSECYVKSKWCLQELAQIVQCQISNNQKVLPIFFNVEPWHVRHQIGSLEETFREHEKNLEPHIIESWREASRVVGSLKGVVIHKTMDQAELVELIVKRVLGELETFDVFLNFRGEGTHKSFTGHLYHALKSQGIRAFMDSYKLWEGEEIGLTVLNKIRRSKISIPVFSKGYAGNIWCLMELVQMLDCGKSNHQIVLPIFLDVETSDVECQTGSFEEAFSKHEKKFEPHIVQLWRDALRETGNLKGWVLKEVEHGDESKLVELVVEWALRETSRIFLTDDKCFIGLDSRVNDLVSLLNIGAKDVQFIGICGIGGIGKTTIVKALHNRIVNNFRRSCFIANIREEASRPNGLVSLQKRLIYDISKRKVHGEILGVNSGKELIKGRLQVENVLLILDDVDHPSQLDALAIDQNWFGQESRIIITTRDETILNVANVDKDKIYWPKELDDDQSLQLFSWLVFQKVTPLEEYRELSWALAIYSRGLPLALEVLSSYLLDERSKEVWKNRIRQFKEIAPKEIYERLKISYDTLEDDYERAIFLDATCFFNHIWEKEVVISFWEACGYYPRSAIHKLIKSSLLKFDYVKGSGYYFRINDHIRDMGRKIVLEESFIEPGKRSRLWSHGEILAVLKGNKGTETLEAIICRDHLPIHLTNEHFEMMPNLRFLSINPENFMGDFSRLPYALRLFRCHNCPLDIQPTKFYHKRLVHLDISNCLIEQAWDTKPQDENKRFQKLKVLNLSKCEALFKSLDFSWFPCLERLDLGHCTSLDKLDESIGKLSRLKILILGSCFSLKELPHSIGDLKALVQLDLSGTMIEELPNSICMLRSLAKLDLSLAKLGVHSICMLTSLVQLDLSSTNLEELPNSICTLRSLVQLDLSSTNLEELPNSICMLSFLEVLILKNCKLLKKLPESIDDLKSLVKLDLSRTKVEELLGLPLSLVELYCEECPSLVRLRDLSRLKNLRILCLSGCEKLEEIGGLEGTESLQNLDARRCYNLTLTQGEKIHGQGKLLPGVSHRDNGYSLTANDEIYNKRLTLCVVLLKRRHLVRGHLVSIDLDISTCIRQKDKRTECLHTLRIKDAGYTGGDIIYIHHFQGFDWFGIPLLDKDAIDNLYIRESEGNNRREWIVKFWKILFHDELKPDRYSSAIMVADFFRFHDDDAGGETSRIQQHTHTQWGVRILKSDPQHILGGTSLGGTSSRKIFGTYPTDDTEDK